MAAKFLEFGGEKAAESFLSYWTNPNEKNKQSYAKYSVPYLGKQKINEAYYFYKRLKLNSELLDYFFKKIVKQYDCTKMLDKIQAPTLLICGELDPIAPLEMMLKLKNGIKNGFTEMVVVPDSGHNIIWENNDFLNEIILKFIK